MDKARYKPERRFEGPKWPLVSLECWRRSYYGLKTIFKVTNSKNHGTYPEQVSTKLRKASSHQVRKISPSVGHASHEWISSPPAREIESGGQSLQLWSPTGRYCPGSQITATKLNGAEINLTARKISDIGRQAYPSSTRTSSLPAEPNRILRVYALRLKNFYVCFTAS